MADFLDMPPAEGPAASPPVLPPMPDAAALAEPVKYMSGRNYAEDLPEEFLKAVGARVIRNKEIDSASGKKWRERQARHLNLFAGEIPGRSDAQKNIVYVHLPYLTKAVLMFHSKLHKHFFPATGDICGVVVSRPEDKQKGRKMSRHMNMYVKKRMPEYVPSHDRGGVQVLLFGSAFSVLFYDPAERRVRFEFCSSDDIILPYKHKSDRVDLADVPRITWRKYYYRHELEALSDPDPDTGVAYYVGVEKLYTQPYGKDGQPTDSGAGEASKDDKEVQEAGNKLMGVEPSTDDPDASREVLEQDCWIALPSEKRQRPCTICVDTATSSVLRLVLREKDDPKDAARFKHEMFMNQAEFQARMADYQQRLVRYQNGDYDEGPPDPMTGMPTPIPIPHPGPPPQPGPPPKPARQVPHNRFTHYQCLPNPDGIYGYGLGYLVEGHNITANEVMSLYVSLMRLNLLPTYLYSRQAKMPRGDWKLVLGEGVESPLPPDQIGKAIFQFQFPQGDPNAFKVEERQDRAVQQVTADDILSGSAGMSGQTAAETEIRASNASDNISMIAVRYNRARANEIVTLAYILSQTLDEPDTFFEVKDNPNAPTEEVDEYVVTKEDYIDEFDVVFTCDPELASRPQREQTALRGFNVAQQIAGAMAGPMPVLDPRTQVMLIRAAAAEYFRALEMSDMAELVMASPMPNPDAGPPPGAPPPHGGPGPGGPGGPPGGPHGNGHAEPPMAGPPGDGPPQRPPGGPPGGAGGPPSPIGGPPQRP